MTDSYNSIVENIDPQLEKYNNTIVRARNNINITSIIICGN